MDKWYKNIYRRSLVDMHINDDKKEYLSKFSAEAYFKYLVDANICNRTLAYAISPPKKGRRMNSSKATQMK